jgi:hypothetical protein
MSSRISIAGCILLTTIIVHTCLRIEVLNARYGYYLPRIDFGGGNSKWRTEGTQKMLLKEFDRRIAYERLRVYMDSHPDEPVPDLERFTGPPYTREQQHSIDAENALKSELHSWVDGMGLLQYLLGPFTLVWAIVIFFADRAKATRLPSAVCVVRSVVSIGLMFYRSYFTSLGW